MPELPEVETIIRHLRKKILGKRIVSFTSNSPRTFRDHKNFSEVRKQVIGRKIESIERIGKNILFNFSGGVCLAVHLMMTGKLLIDPSGESKHDRFLLKLADGTKLVFNDIRKFGRCRIISDSGSLGGEDALEIKLDDFRKIFLGRRVPIKNLLLNQKLVNGIGNIYSDEILWHADISPLRPACSLSEPEIKNIFLAMKKVLHFAIKKQGTSARDYRKPDGTEGGYYPVRKAYHRTGEKCGKDGALIVRIRLGGRSAHYCPIHQK